jgi:hypothetical protein
MKCEVCGRRLRSGVRITVAVDKESGLVLFSGHEVCMSSVVAADPVLASIPNVDLDLWA